jgi:Domain of unknown function (DUF6894)
MPPATRIFPAEPEARVRYFFHVKGDSSAYADDDGRPFASPEGARLHAAVIAGELAAEEDWNGFSVHVLDEQGTEIARVPIEQGEAGPDDQG